MTDGLKIDCFKCSKKITKAAALLFSPPTLSFPSHGDVIKYHICRECYKRVFDFVRNYHNFKIKRGKIK